MNDVNEYLEIDTGSQEQSNSVLSLNSISKSFKLGDVTVQALKDITLNIKRGELAVIHGPSGSGKSTLLNVIGLIDSADEGKMLFSGEDVTTLPDKKLTRFRNKHIGYVFQGFNLIPVLNSLENVMLPLQIGGTPKSEAKERALELLDMVGLAEKSLVRPDKLSGGQRQRVAISRALVSSPELIIADEPTANLDSKSSENIMKIFERLNSELNTTVLIATHDSELIHRIDRKINIVDGLVRKDV